MVVRQLKSLRISDLSDLAAKGAVTLTWLLWTEVVKVFTGFIWLGIGPVMRVFDCVNVLSGSARTWNFLIT